MMKGSLRIYGRKGGRSIFLQDTPESTETNDVKRGVQSGGRFSGRFRADCGTQNQTGKRSQKPIRIGTLSSLGEEAMVRACQNVQT